MEIVFGDAAEYVTSAKKLGISSLTVVGKPTKISGGVDVTFASDKPGKEGIRIIRGVDRSVLERGFATIIYDVEGSSRRDFMHHRNSGLNQVLCKIMADKNIAYGISFHSILRNSGVRRAVLLGRIMQNVRLCKKYGVKIVFASFAKEPAELRNRKDLNTFAKLLGL